MLITGKQSALLAAFQNADICVPTRTTNPIYQNFKLSADDGLTVMATDMEVGIKLRLSDVAVEEPGEALLPAYRLLAILKTVGDQEVRIEADSKKCVVTTFSSEYTMPAESPSDFPDPSVVDDAKTVNVYAGDLVRAIRRTAFAAAKDGGRYAMRGVMLDVAKGKVTMVATDGKRLAIDFLSSVGESDAVGKPLSPSKAIGLVERVFGAKSADSVVEVGFNANGIRFADESVRIYSRLVEGRFPPYRDVVPKSFNSTVSFPASGFLAAVRQAAVMTDDESKRILFQFSGDKLTLTAQGATTGKSKVEFKVDEFTGKPVDISLDPGYLVDMLRVFSDDKLTLHIVDGSKAAVFKSTDDYVYLVVPLV